MNQRKSCLVCSSERLRKIAEVAADSYYASDFAEGLDPDGDPLLVVIKNCAKSLDLDLTELEASAVEYHIVTGK